MYSGIEIINRYMYILKYIYKYIVLIVLRNDLDTLRLNAVKYRVEIVEIENIQELLIFHYYNPLRISYFLF